MKRILLSSFLAALFPLALAAAEATTKPVFLYSRYYNAVGEPRYLPEGTFKDVMARVRGEFEVRVNAVAPTAASLAGVNVLMIVNPSDKAAGTNAVPPHVSAQDVATLVKFVEQGGGLIIMGNQENHNFETAALNKLLARFGLQFVEKFTDVKNIAVPKGTPIIGGLNFGYYTGNQIVIELGHPAKPRSLIDNDVTVKPMNGPRNEPGCLLAVAELGRGRVVLVTDSGWVTNDALSEKGIGGNAVKGHDNWEIMRRLSRWAAGAK